jgi:beta-lactamase superfamily II metal-dependent hydrolase
MNTRAAFVVAVTSISLLVGIPAARVSAQPGSLTIYFIDVEGGQSTLLVTPGRESLLVDTGYAVNGRDAGRIRAAMQDAGVRRIDHLLITHFHRDHMGGFIALSQQVPIGTIYDHGVLTAKEAAGVADPEATLAEYQAVASLRAKFRHVEPTVGSRLPLQGVDATWVSSNYETLKTPLADAEAVNTACPTTAPKAEAGLENTRSTGFYLRFGSFHFADLGDLTGAPLFALVCPTSKLGQLDLYLPPHHGGDDAVYSATLTAFEPVAVVVNNGPAKGATPNAFRNLHQRQGIQDVWQLHKSVLPGTQNYPDANIANLDDTTAHWIKAVALPDGSFSIMNGRTGEMRRYERKSADR